MPFVIQNIFERMNPLRRIAFGNWWWAIPAWLCIAVPGMAQINQTDWAQLFRANAPLGPLVPAGLASIAKDFYTGGRHEMLHEINRRDVITNLLVWISGILKKSS